MKKRFPITVLKVILSAVLALVATLLTLYLASLVSGLIYSEKNVRYQNDRLDYLKNEYYTQSYIPCDEKKLADFDIEKALADGVRLNEIAVIGTHNSYQLKAALPKRMLIKLLNVISFGKVKNMAVFEMDALTGQLEQGVRNLEIDIETVDKDGEVSFTVNHDPILDNVSSCCDFEKALEEIALWSDNNPGHIPVSVLVEPKGDVPSVYSMQNFSVEYAKKLDEVIRRALGDRLLTPGLIMGNYDSLEAMRSYDGWPTLKESAGKIFILLHPCNITQEYIDTDTSLKTQAMFPMLRFDGIDKPYASFILDNDPSAAKKNNRKTITEKNLIVRTRADDFPDFSNERYEDADNCGSQIITTDYPPRSVRKSEHVYSFGGYMFKLIK